VSTSFYEQPEGTPDRQKVKDLYVRHCADVLGAEIVLGEWTGDEDSRAREYDELFVSPDWLSQRGSLDRPGIKIHEDVQVVESSLKTPGGLVRITARLRSGRIDDLTISGDFTIFPRTAVREIERVLRGSSPDREGLRVVLEEKYRTMAIKSPGIAPDHWAEAISLAARSAAPGPP
jgi:lipoate-protein ligase A